MHIEQGSHVVVIHHQDMPQASGDGLKRRESRTQSSVADTVLREFPLFEHQLSTRGRFLPDENEEILESKNIEALIFLCEIEESDDKVLFDKIHKKPLKSAHKTAQKANGGFY